MARQTLLTLILACLWVSGRSYASHSLQYGVGFSLSLDYGVASVYFANGSSVGVAKIEGGLEYKRMMRAQEWSLPGENTELIDKGLDQLRSVEPADSFRDRLPPWLGGRRPSSEDKALFDLLNALKVAIEAYLGSSITAAEIVFPVRKSESFTKKVDRAAARLSLYRPIRLVSPTGQVAALANKVGRNCTLSDVSPQRLVLTVDYSRAAITMMILGEDCGMFEPFRGIHDTTLGADDLSAGTKKVLVSELREMVDVPVEGYDGVLLKGISALVLLGENGRDERLRTVLEEALQSPDAAGVMDMSGADDMINPLFAAAEGTAKACLQRLIGKAERGAADIPNAKQQPRSELR